MLRLKIETHDGNAYEVDVEEYDAQELNEELNNNELNTVVLGDLVVSRINVKSVKPINVDERTNITRSINSGGGVVSTRTYA